MKLMTYILWLVITCGAIYALINKTSLIAILTAIIALLIVILYIYNEFKTKKTS
mgnify:CR=1 FL=1